MREKDERSIPETAKKQTSLWDFIPVPYLAATLAYCAFLYYLSSVSSFPVESPFGFFDKIVHFCLFSGLSATVAIGLHHARHKYSAAMLILIPVGFSAIYGVSDEIHQLFVASRTFALGDMAADGIGATAAAAAVLLFFHRWRSLRK